VVFHPSFVQPNTSPLFSFSSIINHVSCLVERLSFLSSFVDCDVDVEGRGESGGFGSNIQRERERIKAGEDE
jgi:hypothetical protein